MHRTGPGLGGIVLNISAQTATRVSAAATTDRGGTTLAIYGHGDPLPPPPDLSSIWSGSGRRAPPRGACITTRCTRTFARFARPTCAGCLAPTWSSGRCGQRRAAPIRRGCRAYPGRRRLRADIQDNAAALARATYSGAKRAREGYQYAAGNTPNSYNQRRVKSGKLPNEQGYNQTQWHRLHSLLLKVLSTVLGDTPTS